MRESEMVLLEECWPGSKDGMLSLRIQPELLESLKRKAEESEQEFPEFIRGCLAFHVLPDALREMAAEGILDEENKDSLRQLQDYCESILQACRGVETIKRHTTGLKRLSEQMEREVGLRVNTAVDRVFNEMRADIERRESERQAKRKARRLAGIEGPEHQEIRLNESELECLTPSQRRQRQLLGLE